jgi:anti-sigma factor RsiW
MMNEKNRFNAPNDCGRKEDLVAYLYDEANVAERASFKRHLDDCEACRQELKAFERVRDELSAWQVGFAPRAEIALQRGKFDVLRELVGMFPRWVRGAALAGAAAVMMLIAMSIAGASVNVRNGDFAVNFGRAANAETGGGGASSEAIERLVQTAVAREREKIEQEHNAQLTSFKDQLSAEQQAQLEAVKAALRREIQRANRQNPSIRSFFAQGDNDDPWGDVR